jgi:hypothetical protein
MYVYTMRTNNNFVNQPEERHVVNACSHSILNSMPFESRTYEICLNTVNTCGMDLRYVPNNHKTLELYTSAVRQNGFAIRYVPNDFINKELCAIAIRQNNVASKLIYAGILEELVNDDMTILDVILGEYNTVKMLSQCVRRLLNISG